MSQQISISHPLLVADLLSQGSCLALLLGSAGAFQNLSLVKNHLFLPDLNFSVNCLLASCAGAVSIWMMMTYSMQDPLGTDRI